MIFMCKRGEIYYVDFGDDHTSSRQCGFRPALIVSNDVANRHSPVITVIPITAKANKKRNQPTHVFLPRGRGYGLTRDSVALAEQLFTIDKQELGRKIGEITDRRMMEQVTKALKVQIGAK